MRQHLTAKRGWIALGLGVLAYEVAAPEGELLSEGVDRALLSNRKSVRATAWAGITVTALHLLNVLPVWCDPYALLARIRI
ncbi:hypothetical protein L3Y25_gp112 [Gordonia phage Syleon]|uniref:Uncharacterized protein n=2 Tax=Octobienvirus TaxID=3044779 RepID=A0A5Q2WDL4_9CAUD|nr:hypothetical protein L3Y23_gp107 [Gordonia Phage Sephiroth]YP_010246782.1 hypothetical protein L3Y25_gp112 [Gordonia phage Syleon]QGH75852.1 hypothetical protein SEA_SYLEON_129 [Gordonia phage Syleon]QNN99458.1 hypothetical protein SEA_SEPHIROTH_124 [Gordonia Phage Sephiroth]